MIFNGRHFVLCFLLLASMGCQRKISSTIATTYAAPVVEITIDPIKIPDDYSNSAYHGLRYGEDIFKFYGHRSYEPFWLRNNMRAMQADSMITMIRSARRYGLLPQRYHFNEIPELMLEPMDRSKMSRLDLLLTDAFLSMANDLKRGRLRKTGATADSLQVALLKDSLQAADIRKTLEAQEPVYQGYAELKNALNKMLDTLSLTDQNLLLYGVTNDSIDSHRKVQRIEINLERWRVEKEHLSNIFTWINVPAFMFYVYENDNMLMASKVIVGAPATPTPLFSSKIDCFTIFPYWYVPRKIAVEEYLPVIRKDTTFITRNNFDVLDRSGKIVPLSSIDWRQYNKNNFPFTFRQREGTENSLGIIKFIFDNPYAVFLHDTNSKRLFRNNVRAYSHGCIRLEKATEFAHYLIGGGRTKVSAQTLDKYLGQEKRVTISLTQAVPIHIRYFTCDVRNGELQFYKDIYKKDSALIKTLYSQNVF
jgi:L,D-transpeptidase YcbB